MHGSQLSESNRQAKAHMRSVIQRVATGPELSKDLSVEEAYLALKSVLENQVDPVQAAIFLIALRMKRETDDENEGILKAVREVTQRVTADVDHVIDIADPYDGYTRGLPVSPFLPALLAECGLRVVNHGLDAVGPKFGITHRHVLQAAGIEVDLSPQAAADRLNNTALGWSYVDQSQFAPALHDLIGLRQLMIKRQVLTTVEVLAGPIVGKQKTTLVTGYVHKPYPKKYAALARSADFNSLLLVRGVEGGIIPSLRQPGQIFQYHDKGEELPVELSPSALKIEQSVRAQSIPTEMLLKASPEDEIMSPVDTLAAAKMAAELGLAALNGEKGIAYDSLVFSGALTLWHTGKASSLEEAADQIRSVLDSSKAASRLC